jgi:hypothetical protein
MFLASQLNFNVNVLAFLGSATVLATFYKNWAKLFSLILSLYHKTLWIRNLREMDRFRSKLVSFGLDKHTRLSKQRH